MYIINSPIHTRSWTNQSINTQQSSGQSNNNNNNLVCVDRLDQDVWQVLHGPDAAHPEQHGAEARRGAAQEVHLWQL